MVFDPDTEHPHGYKIDDNDDNDFSMASAVDFGPDQMYVFCISCPKNHPLIILTPSSQPVLSQDNDTTNISPPIMSSGEDIADIPPPMPLGEDIADIPLPMSSGEDTTEIPPITFLGEDTTGVSPVISVGKDTTGVSPPIISMGKGTTSIPLPIIPLGEGTTGVPPPVNSSDDNSDNSVNLSNRLLNLLYERYGFLNPGPNV
jgi:hypothetical protein